MATNDKSSEEQLKEQLEQICIDYKQLIDKSKNMPPKDSKNVDPKADANIDEDIEGVFDMQFIDYSVLVYSSNKPSAITKFFGDIANHRCPYLSRIN